VSGAVRRSPTTRSDASQRSRPTAARSSGSPKRRAGPAEDQIAERARLSLLSEVTRRDDGYRARLKRLAADRGVEPGPLIEEWRERAWAMACAEVADADELAFRHVEERLCRST